jgi:hypothetical protein
VIIGSQCCSDKQDLDVSQRQGKKLPDFATSYRPARQVILSVTTIYQDDRLSERACQIRQVRNTCLFDSRSALVDQHRNI